MEISKIEVVFLGGSLDKCAGNDDGVKNYAIVANSSWRRIKPSKKLGHQALLLPSSSWSVLTLIWSSLLSTSLVHVASSLITQPHLTWIIPIQEVQLKVLKPWQYMHSTLVGDSTRLALEPQETSHLVFDTEASPGLSPFKYIFLSDYKPVKMNVKGVTGGGSIIGGCTITRRFKTRCGTKLLLPAHGYHFPEADICLESPQSLIRTMGGSGHTVVDGWNIEWHLPDGRIVDIPIDPATNLPLF